LCLPDPKSDGDESGMDMCLIGAEIYPMRVKLDSDLLVADVLSIMGNDDLFIALSHFCFSNLIAYALRYLNEVEST
jgi:hypothetical protein